MLRKTLTFVALATIATASAQVNTGADLSLVPAYEQNGTIHKDDKGNKINDVVDYLRQNAGMNSVRVRLFVQPTHKSPNGAYDPSVTQDLNYVTSFGKRIKDLGMQFMLNYHYSDTWADPSYQLIPASWTKDTSDAALADSVYNYTKRTLKHLVDNGATPDYVQIGNEISYGMLRRSDSDKCYTSQSATSVQWKRLTALLNAGAKAVREITPEAKIIIHTERTKDSSTTEKYYQYLEQNNVDYDIIGLSYYPFWHGYLTDLAKTLNKLESTFPDKAVQIVETAYLHKDWGTLPSGSTFDTRSTWPFTEVGQASFVKDLINEIVKHKNVNGLYYWCAEEAGNGKDNKVMNGWLNRGFWWEDSQWPLSSVMSAFKTYQTTSLNAVHADSHSSSTTYSITGVALNSEPSKGVFIRNNKKYIK